MSRSYKKSPYIGRGTRISEKWFKQDYNRRMRSKVNTMLNTYHPDELDDVLFPERHIEYGDVWNSKADGKKQYIGHFNSDRQQCYLWWNLVSYDRYVIETYEDIAIAQCQFKIDDTELADILNSICSSYYPRSYSLYRNKVFEINKTLEAKIAYNKKLYAKWMRK